MCPTVPYISYKDRFLISEVRSGRFNKTEFQKLNQVRNGIAACHASLAQDGLSPEDELILNGREAQFDRLADLYCRGDSRVEVDPDPASERFFEELLRGEVTVREGIHYLEEERWISAQPAEDPDAERHQRAHQARLEWSSLKPAIGARPNVDSGCGPR